jgi:ATP-dependent DNA helicase RecQ
LPSRTVLLHSFADRKMHEFFFERDYPPIGDLDRVARVLPDEFTQPEPLAQSIKMAPDQFEKAVIKLIAQGAASVDVAGNVRRTATASRTNWRSGYDAQLAFRRAQLDRIAAFAETQQCRMAALVQHFGDTADGLHPCGHCDFCAPGSTTAQTFAPPTSGQARDLRAILSALAHAPSRATGKLHTDLALGIDRHAFDVLLDALARAGLITITSETFTNSEGKVLPYKKAALTHEGRGDDASELIGVLLPSTYADSPAPSTRKRAARSSHKSPPDPTVALTPGQQQLEEALRAWRKAEAAKTGKPAFIVLADKVLHNIAASQPRTLSELLEVPGIGPDKADRYGAAIIALCRDTGEANFSVESPAVASPPRLARAIPRDPLPSSGIKERTSPIMAFGDDTPTFHRPAHVSDPTADLTPEQQALDQRLREWRKAESARTGAPPFLVLGSSALRSIVFIRPRTVAQLQTIHGVTPEAARAIGPAILDLCNA